MWENQEWERGNGDALKDNVEVQTPGLAQAEVLQEMMEAKLPWWGGAEAEICHPLTLLGPVAQLPRESPVALHRKMLL